MASQSMKKIFTLLKMKIVKGFATPKLKTKAGLASLKLNAKAGFTPYNKSTGFTPYNKSTGFTLLESIVVLMLFVVAVTIASQMYLNLMRSAILAQNMQLALDNFRFGTEKIWAEIKNGSEFDTSSTSIKFLDRKCRWARIYQENNNLIYEINNNTSTIFDDRLVVLKNFQIYYDKPSGNSDFYFRTANKIFVLYYQVDLKTKTLTVPFEFRQAVAPSNSVFLNKPCP